MTTFRSSRGVLYYERLKEKEEVNVVGASRNSWSFATRPVPSWAQPWWHLRSFWFDERPVGMSFRVLALSAPHWLIVVLSAIPPAVRFIPEYRKQKLRARVGVCLICGYDLRASPERCPECGTAKV